jgi:mannose/fructose/N-acetylgalactosamine-specific phosphotransferase system component IID
MRTDQDLALLWLILNLIQLGITAVCCWLLDKKPSWVPYILASLAVCYAILFGFDLEKMSKTRNLFM